MPPEAVNLHEVRVSFLAEGNVVKTTGPVSATVAKGGTIGLVGPSGCGKTTLLRAVAGLIERIPPPRGEGAVLLGDVSLPAGTVPAVMFQETILIPQLTLLENVLVPFLGRDNEAAEPDRTNARELLGQMELGSVADDYPHTLSGGMRTRVGLARALITRPNLLLLDEPFNGLDVGMREKAHRYIGELTAGATIILVTHNLDEAHRLCDRVLVLGASGRLVREVAGRVLAFDKFRQQVVEAFLQ